MTSNKSREPNLLFNYGHLLPFGLLAIFGLVVLTGWWSGNVTLVQPRSFDAPLPANAAACLLFIGLAPILFILGWRKTGLSLGFAASLLGLATLLQYPLALDLGIDQILTQHERLVVGPGVARMPIAFAGVCTLAALLVTWLAARPRDTRLPVFMGLLGSIVLAYALMGLLAVRTGLNQVPAWQSFAQIGPHTAVAMSLLGGGLLLIAARAQTNTDHVAPRWLWMPVTVCGITLTGIFWLNLSQREFAYINSITQLNMDYIAALFSGELEFHEKSLSRLAQRTDTTERSDWENAASSLSKDFEAYRSIQFIGDDRRTKWYWPLVGNEDAPSFNHQADPLRRSALAAALAGSYGITAPLETPGRPLTFAVYVATTGGFVVGEFYYESFFALIDRRLNLSPRYQTLICIEPGPDSTNAQESLRIYESPSRNDLLDPSLQRTARYNILDQRLNLSLSPRPGFVDAGRQYLPEVTLVAGIGISALLGLIVNLAQTALRRQRIAEYNSDLLKIENEERRRIESQLKIADERLNLAFESTQVGVYEWDVETDQIYCTASIWKMIGADPTDMPTTGSGWLNLLHDDDRPAVRAVIDAHFRGETPLIEIEHCVPLRSGEWLWIALRAKCTSFTAARHPRRVLGTVQNINARKRADEALRASQTESRKLSLVASKTDNAVIITDPAGQIEWVNESYVRLTGRPLAQVARRPFLEYLASPDEYPAAVERIQSALVSGEPVSIEALQLATEERRFHVHLDLQPVYNEEGIVENFIAIATNISARVETELMLRQAKETADAASRTKSEFLASMSHEIRTPMNGVIGMTSLLFDTDLNPEQHDFVSTIRTSGDALLAIINEILDFSKIEAGKMELESQPFELAQCVEEVVDIFATQAAAKNIELAYWIDSQVPAIIQGDTMRLRQILANLVNNAVKFTPQGSITIAVSLAAPGPVNDSGFLLDFFVTDTGIGIPAERYDLLFKPFSQVDASTTRKYGGTGLGLAICLRLSEMMGGSIEVKSTVGVGSCFKFCIQTSTVMLDNTTELFPPLNVHGAVLAVDDLALNRTMLSQCIRSWSLDPRLAVTVEDALQVANTGDPLTAAIIDQDLAGVSADELIKQLRTIRPTLPIVVLLPAHRIQNRDETLDSLVVHFTKPIKPYPLHNALRRVLAGAAAQEATGNQKGETCQLANTIPLKILLVEDNLVNQKVALGYLNRMGYKAKAVADGVEAVAAVQKDNFDLIFMDLQMPVMDGFTATKQIRSLLPPDQQPIILALTANAMQGDREQCLAVGMNDHMAKPVKFDALQAAIQRHFGSKGA